MSYLVLARKHRPQTFDEVIGQDHITELLKKAIKAKRLTHAFLFCGPRGVGKTSCARILAKSLNCEKGPTLKPCGQCAACREIAKGTSFDVLEIDGASNRGIDEIRILRENVKFAPSAGQYKIYIVDEVHMLTAEAFNALLKTLEEPPDHVKFIFATTAPNKVPATIISRCQRYDFKRVPIATIVDCLASVSKKEKLKVANEALYAIAKAAEGSLRDALSILDQLSALGDGGIKADDVYSMLGLVETRLLFDLADAVGQKDCAQSLKVLEKIIDQGKDLRQLTKDMTEHFRHLMVIKVGGKALGRLVDYPVAVKEMILTQTKQFTLQEILAAIDTLIGAQDHARITESVRMPLEVALAKLTYRQEPRQGKEAGPVSQKRLSPSGASGFTPANVLRDKKGHVDISGDGGKDRDTEEALAKVDEEKPALDLDEKIAHDMDKLVTAELGGVEEPAAADLAHIKRAWDAITHEISREKMSVATFLNEAVPHEVAGNRLTIAFPPQCGFQKETLESEANLKLVERVLKSKLKAKMVVRYTIVEACAAQEETEDVREALDTFKGKVVSRWHEEKESS